MFCKEGGNMLKNMATAITGTLGVGGAVALYIGMGLGWLYWIYMGVKLGSFMMVILAILGPLGFIASVLGLWSFIFGIPLWLLQLVH
jgi:hypothetical protein